MREHEVNKYTLGKKQTNKKKTWDILTNHIYLFFILAQHVAVH